MTRALAIVGSIIFFIIAPFTLAGVVPYSISGWQMQPAFFEVEPLRFVGAAMALAGLYLLLDSFARFAVEGLGTPAPIAPPQHLVVSGIYRYVRNPMYVGVVSAILGQALVFGDRRLAIYGAIMWLAFHLFVLAYEEPTLRQSFGEEYKRFCRNVPRWIPRLTAWSGEAS